MMFVTFLTLSISFVFSLIVLVNLKSYYMMVIIIIFFAFTIFLVFKGGCTDPGIIPRQMGNNPYFRRKKDFNIISNGAFVKFSYCYTCDIFKPPRTSHCSVCDNCCRRFDHHCLWLGNCIGQRNYKYFFLLVTTLIINAIIEIVYYIFIIVQSIKDKEEKKIKFRLFTIIVLSFVTFYDFMFIVFFLGKLEIIHLYLLIGNITYYEYFKKKLKNAANNNPYYKSIWQHIYRLIICFSPKSLLNGTKKIMKLSNNIDDISINKKIKTGNKLILNK